MQTTIPVPNNNPTFAIVTTPLIFDPSSRPFCFCVRGGITSPVAEPSVSGFSIWFAGLGDIFTALGGFAVFIFGGPIQAVPTKTYKLLILPAGVVVETIPVDGALHDFKVCRDANNDWTLTVDGVAFPVPNTAPPAVLLNAAFGVFGDGPPPIPGVDALVDSYCLEVA